ncbi:MAG: protein kinase [Rubripirellula sp.]
MTRSPTVNLKKPTQSPQAVETDTLRSDSPSIDTAGGVPANQAVGGALKNWSGEILGEYEIGERIGLGGNGQVYKARHRCLDMLVALKILHGVEAGDQASVDRFRREAMASARLRRPHLVRATDAGILGQHLFLVTDLVDGVDLNELVGRYGVLSIANACEVGRAACSGLQYLTENATVHRDIKPSNIMLDRTGNIRVLDLGLARTNDLTHSLTVEGQLMGTLDYMSPEQALSPRDVDFQADMYSMGCTLYFLLTGHAPFQTDAHDTLAAKLVAHMEVEAAPIREVRKDVPPAVANVIMAMLEKSVSDRPASFTDVIAVLSRFADSQNLVKVIGGEMDRSAIQIDPPKPSHHSTRLARGKNDAASGAKGLGTLAGLVVIGVVILGLLSLSGFGNNLVNKTIKDENVRAGVSTVVPSEADRKPPSRLNENGLKGWQEYLDACCHKAFVYDPVHGSWAYALGKETREEAIASAKAFGGTRCQVFSVDGFTVEGFQLNGITDKQNSVAMIEVSPTPQKQTGTPESVTEVPTAADRIPPKGLSKDALQSWEKYLSGGANRAFVYHPATKRFGYATARVSSEEAIKAAHEYCGTGGRLFSVNGVTQQPGGPRKRSAPARKGSLQVNQFTTE